MPERSFLDTNVLVYADDVGAKAKRRKAESLRTELVATGVAVVSTQVLQEYFAAATRKLHMPADVARRKVELLSQLEVVIVRPELILAAIDLHRLHSLSFWDALIVRSAIVAGCARVLSEDLQDGRVIEGVRIENPFGDS